MKFSAKGFHPLSEVRRKGIAVRIELGHTRKAHRTAPRACCSGILT